MKTPQLENVTVTNILSWMAFALFVISSLGPVSAQIPAGSVDVTFNTGGGFVGRAQFIVGCLFVQRDGKIVVGGEFTSFDGVARNGIVRLNSDGSLDQTFDPGTGVEGLGIYSSVDAVAQDAAGNLMIGGNWATYNGIFHPCLARITTNGTLDTTFTGFINETWITIGRIVIQPSGKIIVTGQFSHVNSDTSTGYQDFVRFLPDGRVDTNFVTARWDSSGDDIGVIQDTRGAVYLTRRFGSHSFGLPYDSQRLGIARLNDDDTIGQWTMFPVWVTGIGAFQPDGKIITVRSSYSGIIGGLDRFNPDGSLDPTFVPVQTTSGNSQITSVALQSNGKILLAGSFSQINGLPSTGLARLFSNGCTDTQFRVDIDDTPGGFSPIYHVRALSNDQILFGGDFDAINSQPYPDLVRLNNGDSVDEIPEIIAQPVSTTAAVGGTVSFVVQAVGSGCLDYQWQKDGIDLPLANCARLEFPVKPGDSGTYRVRVSNTLGSIMSMGAVLTVTLSRIGIGSIDPFFASGRTYQSNPIMGLLRDKASGDLIIFGDFNAVGGRPRKNLARLRPDGSLDGSLQTFFCDDIIWSGALYSSNRILIGGDFESVNGVQTGHFAMLDFSGSLDTNFNVNIFGQVHAIQPLKDGRIAVGGFIQTVNGTARSHLILLNSNGSPVSSFRPGFSSGVLGIAVQPDGKFVVGGAFTTVNGTSFPHLARVNADGSLDYSFSIGSGANSDVETIVVQNDGKIVVAGRFTTFNGAAAPGLVRLQPNGTVDPTFVPAISGGVINVKQDARGRYLVAFYSGRAANLLRLQTDGTVDRAFGTNTFGFDTSTADIVITETGNVIVGGGEGVTQFIGEGYIVNVRRGASSFAIDALTFTDMDAVLQATEFAPPGQWTEVTRVSGDGTVKTLTDSTPPRPQRFYRLLFEPSGPVTLSIDDYSNTEGQSGAKTFPFVVRLNRPTTQNVRARITLTDGSAKTIFGFGRDVDLCSGVSCSSLVSFSPGETSKTINIYVLGDTTVEPDEDFFVNLTEPVGAVIGQSPARGVILNDD